MGTLSDSSDNTVKNFSANEETREFIEKIWGYTSVEAKCYVISWLTDKISYKIYCLKPLLKEEAKKVELVENYDELYAKASELVEDLSKDSNIYYQVLPLSKIPQRGRGSASDVSVGKWLWADIDYKEEVEKAEFEGCKELKDFALKCYYREGNKIIKVERPPLLEILNILRNYNLEPAIVVDSGAGYHLYFKLETEIDAKGLKALEDKLIDFLNSIGIKVDAKAKDLARILRLPGTVNPRTKRVVKVIYQSEKVYSAEELERILKTEETGLKVLGDDEILKIKELIKDAYKPGVRQFLILYLSGWLAQAKIHPISAIKLAKLLHETTQDEDPLKERLAAVIYTYKKAGIDVDKYAEEIERETEVKPYGLEREINEGAIKGYTGVQEILEKELGEDKALTVLKELQDIIETASPYQQDAIFVKVDDSKNLFVVVDFKRKMVRRAMIDGNIQYKERIVKAVPVKVEVYENPVGGITKYVTVWESNIRSKPIVIGPATIDEITAKLLSEGGLVLHKRLVEDAVNAVITVFIEKGKAELKSEVEAPGFYLIDGKINANRIEIKKPANEELKEALLLLNELAGKWFSHVIDKFATIIKWGIVAPFGFVYKQRGAWLKWIYLYGASATGKTTLAEIVLSLWGLGSQYVKSGAHVDNIARLGFVLSQSTFPTLINEPGPAIKNNENVIETIKNAIDEKTVRGKFVHGNYVEYPALSLLIFASNKILPSDDALIRRLIVIHFTPSERIPEEKAREFEREVKPRLAKLKAVGDYISYIILNNNELLGADWEVTATKLLELAYKETSLEVPQWIYEKYESEDNIYDDMIERIREFLHKKFVDEYTMKVGKITEADSIRRIAQTVLSRGLIPWAKFIVMDGYNEVRFKQGFADELKNVIGDISLKSLAELLGWEYKNAKEIEYENGKKVVHVPKAIVVKFDDLIRFLEDEE